MSPRIRGFLLRYYVRSCRTESARRYGFSRVQRHPKYNVGADVGHPHAVVKRLAEVSPHHPALTVACLERVVRALLAAGPKEGWAVVGIERHALTVLQAGVEGNDEFAEQKAREIANVLVSKGFGRFEALIGAP